MSRKQTKYQNTHLNNETYLMYYNRLRDYALSMFEWKGLPDSVNKSFLEKTMYEQGKAVFFYDDTLGYLALPVLLGYSLNVYQEPTTYQAITSTYNKELSPDNAVLIWGNYSRIPIQSIIMQFAYRLYQVERTIDINVRGMRTPLMILTDDSQRLTMKNVYMQYDGNEPVIFANKSGFDLDSVKVLRTDVPVYLDKLLTYKHKIWNDAMTFLGINNHNMEKRERMVADEIASNDEQIESSRYIFLNARQEACEKINKLFGLNVSVQFKLQQQEEKSLPSQASPVEDQKGEGKE